jgi:catechol 2,3-dioxygenase-like lactoylglutathione lyase family enzyme
VERVEGIGGVFFRSRDPERLRDWYAEHLGLELAPDFTGTIFRGAEGDVTVWSLFPADTDYFGSDEQQLMVNYRVADLDAMLAQLRGAGVELDNKIEEHEYGRFAWGVDPDGNRFELWQPPTQ